MLKNKKWPTLSSSAKESHKNPNQHPTLDSGGWSELSSKDKKFLKSMHSYIVENYGERCEDLCPGCKSCQVWQLFDLTVSIFL